MAYQITLTPEEYQALAAAASQAGKTVEALVHETLAERYPSATPPQPQRQVSPLLEYMYRMGHISHIPERRPITPKERAERERLARSVAPGKPASEMVIEDRGPR